MIHKSKIVAEEIVSGKVVRTWTAQELGWPEDDEAYVRTSDGDAQSFTIQHPSQEGEPRNDSSDRAMD